MQAAASRTATLPFQPWVPGTSHLSQEADQILMLVFPVASCAPISPRSLSQAPFGSVVSSRTALDVAVFVHDWMLAFHDVLDPHLSIEGCGAQPRGQPVGRGPKWGDVDLHQDAAFSSVYFLP